MTLSARLQLVAIVAALSLGACDTIDKILEADEPVELSVGTDSASLTVPVGTTRTLTLRVTPSGNLAGAITLRADKVLPGMRVTFTNVVWTGKYTTATVTVEVAPEFALGRHDVHLLARTPHAKETGRVLPVNVVSAPNYTMTLGKSAVTIAQGGSAPLAIGFVRTNYSHPIALSLDGAPAGVTAAFATSGAVGDATTASILVAAAVAPGVYDMAVRGSGPEIADRSVPLRVVVTADAIQLIVDDSVATPQATSGSVTIVVNRRADVGAVTLSAEGLPAGVTATFDKPVTTDASVRLTLATAGTVDSGRYVGTVRATSPGVPDATAAVTLAVADANIALTAAPTSTEVLQGQNASVSLAITRTRFAGDVALSVTSAPAGLTATPLPATTTGTAASLRLQASSSAAAGTYDLSVKATPVGLASAKAKVVVVRVTVRAVPTGANVVLDWSGCSTPTWIASQDGTAAWTQVAPAGSLAGFLVTAGRGAYAWTDGSSLNVRYALQAELTAKPIPMCPPTDVTGTKYVTGIGVHILPTEFWTYQLGGGTGSSSGATPAFTISGIAEGKHDLVVTGTSFVGQRILIRRDLDLPSGSAIEPVDLAGPEGFAFVPRTMTIGGAIVIGEALSYAYNYLTTPACVENQLASGTAPTVLQYNGVPENAQRADDYHELVATSIGLSGTRRSSLTFHTAANRTVALPALTSTPVVASLGGQNYMQLRATFVSIPIVYNGSIVLNYRTDARSMSVGATIASTGSVNATVAMPDLSGVSGWSSSYALPPTTGGSWRLTVDGTNTPGSRCAEGRTAVLNTRTGVF